MMILTVEQIALAATVATKDAAIEQAGQLLVQAGVVSPRYVEGMALREATMSTYMGNGVAIPHGTHDHIADIHRTGISVVQLRDGVDWGDDEVAHLVIGIAANSDEHLVILSNLAEVMEDEATVAMLTQTDDPQLIIDMLMREPELEVD